MINEDEDEPLRNSRKHSSRNSSRLYLPPIPGGQIVHGETEGDSTRGCNPTRISLPETSQGRLQSLRRPPVHLPLAAFDSRS